MVEMNSPISIRLPEETQAQLQSVIAHKGQSRSAYVLEAINEKLKADAKRVRPKKMTVLEWIDWVQKNPSPQPYPRAHKTPEEIRAERLDAWGEDDD